MKSTFKNKLTGFIMAVLCFLFPVIILLPIPAYIIDIMIILFTACIAGSLLILPFLKSINSKIIYSMSGLFIKSSAILLIIKEAVIHDDNSSGFIKYLADITPLQNNPVSWAYALIIIIFFYYMIFKYMIRPRVAMTARFALDVMPGKQMSIDSALANDEITIEEAADRREQLIKETDMAGTVHDFVDLLFYEGTITIAMYLLSIIAIILQEYFSTGMFFIDTGVTDIITLNIAVILSATANIIFGFEMHNDLKV